MDMSTKLQTLAVTWRLFVPAGEKRIKSAYLGSYTDSLDRKPSSELLSSPVLDRPLLTPKVWVQIPGVEDWRTMGRGKKFCRHSWVYQIVSDSTIAYSQKQGMVGVWQNVD